MLFFLAEIEFERGRSDDGRLGQRRAVELLAEVERLLPNLCTLYEFRSRCWEALGDQRAARADGQRAEALAATIWLDHFQGGMRLLAAGQYAEAANAFAAALALQVDDYWSWMGWS